MNKQEFADSIAAYFAELKDPRNTHTVQHDLGDILTIAILAILCGANSFVAMEEFGTARAEWLKTFLALSNGIPSHDTFGRLFATLNPKQLTALFQRWTDGLATATEGDIIAIDGKALRRSFTSASRNALTHMVSAWSTLNGLTLAQVKTDTKSNEITAIPRLLELLDLRGALVTMDAMGCQTEIAEAILEGGGDYLLAVKGNHPSLEAEISEVLDNSTPDDTHETEDRGHGRLEVRRCRVSRDLAGLASVAKWKGLSTIVRVETIRDFEKAPDKTAVRYFISSRGSMTAAEALAATRAHWGIENKHHWVLDMAYREDESRVRVKNAAENFSILRQLTANLHRKAPGPKVGMEIRRLRAGWEPRILLETLFARRA